MEENLLMWRSGVAEHDTGDGDVKFVKVVLPLANESSRDYVLYSLRLTFVTMEFFFCYLLCGHKYEWKEDFFRSELSLLA